MRLQIPETVCPLDGSLAPAPIQKFHHLQLILSLVALFYGWGNSPLFVFLAFSKPNRELPHANTAKQAVSKYGSEIPEDICHPTMGSGLQPCQFKRSV